MKTEPAQFRNVYSNLVAGNYVDTVHLREWVKDATDIYHQLLPIPEFALTARELLSRVHLAEAYLRNRTEGPRFA